MYCSVWESFTPWAGRSIDAAHAQRGELDCIPGAKVGICWRLVQQKGHTVGLLPVWQRLLEMQAKSFRPIPRSINTASVQILSNATLMLIVVCDVTVSSHLSTLHFLQYKYNTGNRKINKYWQINIWLSQLALYNNYATDATWPLNSKQCIPNMTHFNAIYWI